MIHGSYNVKPIQYTVDTVRVCNRIILH
jgi:hypothetical protein